MGEATPNRRERRKARTAGAILAAAREIYARDGFGGGTVEEVAERADVAVGSVYNHFGSKRGLELAVAEDAARADERFMDAAYVRGASPAEQVREAGRAFLRFYRRHPDYFRILAFPGPVADLSGEEVRRRVAGTVEEQNARLAAALRRGVEEGVVRDIEPEAAAKVLWSAWSGIIALAWRPDLLRVDGAELEALIDVAADIVAEGLAPRG